MNSTVPVAVVGLGAFTPGASDVAGFWRTVLSGRDMITDVPASHWLISDYYDPDPSAPDKTYGRRGAFLSPVDFDPLGFGVPPKSVQATDTTQLLSLMVADAVLRDYSGVLDRDRVSVILGSAPLELLYNMASRLQRPVWLKSLREAGVAESLAVEVCDRIAAHYVPWQEASFPGMLSNVVAGRIANRFDLHGTNCTTDAACASSLAAVSSAVNELSLGQSDMVITGGVDTLNDILMYMCFSKTPALSPTGDCRPFSSSADGTMLGEGLVMFALKRLDDAEAAGDRIYAVIRGIGTASDGKSTAIYAPLPSGQERALSRAYDAAGYGPDTVELVEAHGTGTVAGDAAEFAALRSVFSASGRADTHWCALGSVKSQIGHTKAAAGAAGMLKAVLSLQHKVLPPTIKVSEPSPALELESSPLYLNTVARPWVRSADHPRRASVSSFGFGGSNFHLALEEYTGPTPAFRSRSMPSELVLVSASSLDGLVSSARALSGSLAGIARASHSSFDASAPERLAIIATSVSDLTEKVSQFASRRMSLPGVWYGSGPVVGPVAFLFPGQGSQYVGMGADVAMHFPGAGAVWDRSASLGLHDVVFPVPVFSADAADAQQDRLTATECAQPALALTSLSLLSILDSLGVRASFAGGHSFGELVALHYAGVLSESSLLALARRRGELMRDAGSPGAMLAVTASRAEVESALAGVPDWWIANHNAPAQVIISGTPDAIAAATSLLASFNPKRLNTATAFHCPIVSSASAPLLEFLSTVDVSAGSLPVYGNADASVYPSAPAAIRERVASHLATPVDFVAQIEAMYAAGARTFVEVGAGATVSRLTSRILTDRPHVSVSLDRPGRDGVTSLFDALGQLAAAGVAMDFTTLWADYAPEPPAQDTKPRMTMPISGANYDRPYPPANGESELPPPNPETPTIPAGSGVAAATTGTPKPAVSSPAAVPPARPANGAPVTLPAARVSATPLAGAPATATIPAPAAPIPADAGWLAAYQDLQRQTAEVHAAYQKAMTETHLSYLRATEAALHSLAGTEGLPSGGVPSGGLAAAPPALPLSRNEQIPAPVPATPSQRPVDEPVFPAALATPPATPPPLPLPTTPNTPANDLRTTLLAVVADKTGYPADLLTEDMELESDLGIDSIKRVEILSALREQAPGLPEVDAAELGRLHTLGEIATALGTASPAAPAADLSSTLLAVVADKTGYPADLLTPDMRLETDLGIDSIKRVEILSALREQAPGLPDVDPAQLGKLHTLGEIATAFGTVTTTKTGTTTKTATTTKPVTKPSTAPDLKTTLLAVVADKTGYPADLLTPDMRLETDLGIDSIKRVEILSALRERVPDLPEVNVADLGKLHTLGEIAQALDEPATSTLSRQVVKMVPAKASGLNVAGLTGGRLVVTDDGRGTAEQVVTLLAEHDVKAEVVTEVPDDAQGVIFLGGLKNDGGDVNREAFEAAKRAVDKKLFVTVQDTGGDFGLSGSEPDRVHHGGIAGLARSAAREWPDTAVKVIDVQRDEHTARHIVDELWRGGDTLDVGIRGGQRYTVGTEEQPVAETNPISGVIVATGGARGVTAEALIELSKQDVKLVLIGRTPLTPDEFEHITDETELKRAVIKNGGSHDTVTKILATREIRRTLSRMQCEVRYEAVDVTDAKALNAKLDEVRAEWGPITGIVHGAGVLADRRIADLTAEQFDHVIGTKVKGLEALLDATRNDPLTHLCLFSSIAARAGNAGQSAYAIANEVLNQVASAEQVKHPDRKVVSIAWGAWAGGMVTPSLAQHFHSIGVPLIPLREGAEQFVKELTGAGHAAQVVIAPPGTTSLVNEVRTVRADIRLKDFPVLTDHVIEGTPVVPIALAVEWFAAATGHDTLLDLTVLRKITTDDEMITLRGKGNTIELSTGVPHYRAVLGEPSARSHQWNAGTPNEKTSYDGFPLFHGPRFQAITDHVVTKNDATATVIGARRLGWDGDHWRTDPAAVDACLQLALLWGKEVFGGNSLPMGVREFRLHRPGLVGEPVRCVLAGGVVHDGRAECDVAIVDASGTVRAELFGISIVRRPQ